MNSAILIGFGEVGKAHFEVLRKAEYTIHYKDKDDAIYDMDGLVVQPVEYDIMLIATQCDPANMRDFCSMVSDYYWQFSPSHIDVLTTTPCGTCEKIVVPCPVTRSTIRGMHPNLAKFLIDIPKHIGGPNAAKVAQFYRNAGITVIEHEKARTVELCHILNNFIYGVNVMAADECAYYCRELGVDYIEVLKYRETNNKGFLKAGYPSKVSPVLYPSGGKIGGHCVRYAPTTIPDDIKGPLAKMLGGYGDKPVNIEKCPICNTELIELSISMGGVLCQDRFSGGDGPFKYYCAHCRKYGN